MGERYLPGDQTWRAFLSDNGVLIDPGDLGGTGSYVGWLNEAGDAARGSFSTVLSFGEHETLEAVERNRFLCPRNSNASLSVGLRPSHFLTDYALLAIASFIIHYLGWQAFDDCEGC